MARNFENDEACLESFGVADGEIDLNCEETLSDYEDNIDDVSFTHIDVDRALKGFHSEAKHANISDMFVCDHYIDVNCCCDCFKKKALMNLKDNKKVCSAISTVREGIATIPDNSPTDDSGKLTRIKPKPRDEENRRKNDGESDVQYSLSESSESKRAETDTEETTDGEDDTSTVLSQLSITDDSSVPSQEEPIINSNYRTDRLVSNVEE